MTQSSENLKGSLRRLRLYNTKAAELSQLSFSEKAFHKGAGASLKIENGRTTIQKSGADREATAALALTLRLFLQQRDEIQLEQIVDLYQTLPIPDEDKYWVKENLNELNLFLDGTRTFEFAIDGIRLTNRMILETFLYGDLAHVNEDKRKLYEIIRAGPGNLLIESTFEHIVGSIMRYIFWLAYMNEDAIRALEARLAIE